MKKIAIFDLSITTDSPAGSCILQLVENLADDYQFIVFADRFENPDPQNITWIRVPLPDKPVIARYICFQYLAPIYYNRFLQQQSKPDLIVATEGEFADCDICYVHFCHRQYLKEQRPKIFPLRNFVRFANHCFNAYTEAKAIAKASTIAVPSQGFANQLSQTYSTIIKREIEVIPNPVDVEHFTRPLGYDAETLRQEIGFASTDIVLVFVALGNFDRKGLDFVLRAMARLKNSRIKLLVVGGSATEVNEYTSLCDHLGVTENVKFTGLQSDIRPYLWSSNLFVLPSSYETFSLVTFQAAIAGLPVMVTHLHGVDEFLEPGVNGWLITRDEGAISQVLKTVAQGHCDLPAMGARARSAATSYGVPQFVERWRSLLEETLIKKTLLEETLLEETLLEETNQVDQAAELPSLPFHTRSL